MRTRRSGRGRNVPVFRSRISAVEVFLEVDSKQLDADLVHSRGPAIPLDGLEGLSHEPGSDPPGQRMHLDLFHGGPFTPCNHEVRTGVVLGMFLSKTALAAFPGFPSKSTGRPFWGLSRGANFPLGHASRPSSSVGFSFHFAGDCEATPDLLLPLKRRRFRRPSPHRRVAGPFRRWLMGTAYRPSDGGGLHRSWLGTIFSRRPHVAPSWSAPGNPHHRVWGGRLGLPSALRRRAVSGAPTRPRMPSPGVTLPGLFVAPPSPVPPVATRWLRTSAEVAEFEQGVLHGCGPAQVGFGDWLSSFHRVTVSSRGKLSPEPLRLTRPFRARIRLGFVVPGRCPRSTTQVITPWTPGGYGRRRGRNRSRHVSVLL